MLGSIDYMYLAWKNCPSAWQGMYKGYNGVCNVIFEAVADYYLWIWNAFFGMEESHNDVNVLQRSLAFARLTKGNAPSVNYVMNIHTYTKGYYLADDIYPQWSTIVKKIREPYMENKQ
jgi:hypothetical protein